MVTAAEAEGILAENKVIAMNMAWIGERRGQEYYAYKLRATVMSEESGEILILHGYVGRKNRSFVLLYKNSPIRKYTVHDRHTDPVTRIVYTEPHKHWWDDVWEDNRVYIPDDIRIGDPNEELMDFLVECNISLRGSYQPRSFFQDIRGGSQ